MKRGLKVASGPLRGIGLEGLDEKRIERHTFAPLSHISPLCLDEKRIERYILSQVIHIKGG
jgi:hypothetical protein